MAEIKAGKPKNSIVDRTDSKPGLSKNPGSMKNGGFSSEPSAKDESTHYVKVTKGPKARDYC